MWKALRAWGTTFEIELPCCGLPEYSEPGESEKSKADLHSELHTTQNSAPAGLGETVLYVEDDEMLLLLTETILQENGYNVIPMPNGNEALKYFWQNRESIDLVLTDQVMPGLSGVELAAEIRSIDSEVPIILASGKREQVNSECFDASLVKPIDKEILTATVRNVLDGRREATLAEA